MSGLGKPDEGAEQAIIMSENEVDRVRALNKFRASRPSRATCLNCDNEIPLARRLAVVGCQYCVKCQDSCDQDLPRIRTLTKML